MGMILRIASSRIVGQGDIVGRSGRFSLKLSANSGMRGRLDARRTLKSLVADLRINKNINMAQNFYTKWQDAILADAGGYVSKEYRRFQTAFVRKISKYATAVGAQVASKLKGHYDTSCFIERNGKFVYINHSSTLARMGSGVRVELDSFLIRTAQHAKDYRGGYNQYCDIANLQSMMDDLLKE